MKLSGTYGVVVCALLLVLAWPVSAEVSISTWGQGGIRLGTTGVSCDGTNTGSLRWHSGNGCVEVCDGTNWTCANHVGACDGTPLSIVNAFTDINNATHSDTDVESNIVEIIGTDPLCNINIGVSGDGNPEYRICSDNTCTTEVQTWTQGNGSFDMNGGFIQVRADAPATSSTIHNITVSVGPVADIWQLSSATSGPCGAVSPGDEGTVCPDGSVYAGVSPDGNRNMYVTRCDLGQTWDGSACTGTRDSYRWGGQELDPRVSTGIRDANDGDGNTANLVTMDSNTITTGIQPHEAAQACADETVHGRTDWYLPAYNELRNIIYENLYDGTPNDNSPDPVISGFVSEQYWSSSESNWDSSWRSERVDFSNGGRSRDDKEENKNVRCARLDAGYACGASPVGTVCADGSVYAGLSPDGSVPMFVPRCDLGMTWDGAACSGVRTKPDWNDGMDQNSNFVSVWLVDDSNGAMNAVSTGAYNTSLLATTDSEALISGTQPHPAAEACDSLNMHSKTDWYLPARDELLEIYEKLYDGTPNDNSPDPVADGFGMANYWSSTQTDTGRAFSVSFADGSNSWDGKEWGRRIRCARKD